jgi:hypothetical protein
VDNNKSAEPRPAGEESQHAAELRRVPFELPKGVHPKHGRYYLIHRNKWHKLTRIDEGAIPFWRAYYRLTRADPEYMAGVMIAFLEEGVSELAAETRAEYEKCILRRLIPWCGHMHRDDLESSHIAMYLEKRKQADAPAGANREVAVLGSVCNFGMRKGWMRFNPCRGVRRNTERPSSRYVRHDELVPELDRAPPELYALMGIAYVLGIRQTDLRHALLEQINGDLLLVTESKTGKPHEHEITKTVRILLNAAAAHREAIASGYERAAEKLDALSQYHRAKVKRAKAAAVRAQPYIFLSARGRRWTKWGLQSALRRFGAAFRFRDLRPKSETDRPGTLGHTGQMQRRYTKVVRLKAVK